MKVHRLYGPYAEREVRLFLGAGRALAGLEEQTPPACRDVCVAVLKRELAKVDPDCEATFSWLPPLVDSGYTPLAMRCPHGIVWYAEPTSEQIARWTAEGVE